MSVIAATKYFEGTRAGLLKSILIASKGSNARCMESVLSYLVDADSKSTSNEMMIIIQNQIKHHKQMMLSDPAFLKSLHLFTGNINRIISDQQKDPKDIVKAVIIEFSAFRSHHNLPYIDIRRAMDSLLLSLTISKMSRNPERCDEILNQSMSAFEASLKRENDYGVPIRRASILIVKANAKFNKLKGLLELTKDDAPRKLNFGITNMMPMPIVDAFKHHLIKLFNHEQSFDSAINLLNIVENYKVYPTGKSGMISSKGTPVPLSQKFITDKLSQVLKDHGAKAFCSQVAHLTSELRGHKMSVMIGLAKTHPEQIELFKQNNFSSTKYDDSIFELMNKAKEVNQSVEGVARNYYQSKKIGIKFGPDFPLFGPAFGSNYAGQIITLKEYLSAVFPTSDVSKINHIWHEVFPDAEPNAIGLNGKVVTYPTPEAIKPKRAL
ncbi:hypothetical protein [Methylotenera sp.]|uniref:hypothetical protein n=1 Tax=Methylotenera sp. TaxID=2051956 RepID=UPI0025F44CA5|nr:hypothetical protein [Methylotenera sp.]